MTLADRLTRQIAAEGPITVAQYMTACLHDPTHGYYAIHPSLGGEGADFLTAPLVSQMFGELIGLWAVETWRRMGRPAPFRLVELGPGDGTLMADALRAARLDAAFLAAADLWLVEPSGPLKACQQARLADAGPHWTERLDAVPAGAPTILMANEVLDCLPARQFLRTAEGWAERRVGLDGDGRLVFGLGPAPKGFAPPPGLEAAPEGVPVEVSPAQEAMGSEIGHRIAQDRGAALLIDYGRDRPEAGDTLQAVLGHEKLGPLDRPGETDLTVHADFPAVVAAARAEGAAATPILAQASFLAALGIEARAEALAAARPERAEGIERQFRRLTDPDQMGLLFKAVAIHEPGLAVPGFEDAT